MTKAAKGPPRLTSKLFLDIDGDPIRYRVGFAAETPIYVVVAENKDGQLGVARFMRDDAQSAKEKYEEWREANKELTIVSCEKTVDAESVPHVRQMVLMQVMSIQKEVRKHFNKDVRDVVTQVFLSSGGNYRDQIATLKPYKGNRDPSHKPFHYATVKDVLKSTYNVVEVTGIEADDALSLQAWDRIRAGSTDYVIATIDKDLDQIPGWHYDYMKKNFYFVTPDEGQRWFWQQTLSGDSTDNIGGACKVGPVSAESFLSEWEAEYLETEFPGPQEEFIWQRVVSTFADRADRPGCYYSGRDPESVALENARLVYLQRERGELWTPPGVDKEYLKTESIDD